MSDIGILKKQIGEPFDTESILQLLETNEGTLDYVVNFRLYELLDDSSFLIKAVKEIEKIAANIPESDDFYKLPIPTKIINESKNIQATV